MRKNTEEKLRAAIEKKYGTEPGGLLDLGHIKVLICFVLGNLGRPMSREQLDEALPGSGLVNFFDYSHALAELLESGNVIEKDGMIEATERGVGLAMVLKDDLPLSVRDRVISRAFRLMQRDDAMDENDYRIEESGGTIRLICTVREKTGILMRLNVAVGSGEAAAALGRRFAENPNRLYTAVFAVLSGDAEALADIALQIVK